MFINLKSALNFLINCPSTLWNLLMRVFCCLLNQTNFTETLNIFKNWYDIILGKFKFNIFPKQHDIFEQKNFSSRWYQTLFPISFLKRPWAIQFVKPLTGVKSSISTLIDHILTIFPKRISKSSSAAGRTGSRAVKARVTLAFWLNFH